MKPYEEFNLSVIVVLIAWTLFVAITGYQTHLRMEHNTKVYYGEINGVYE